MILLMEQMWTHYILLVSAMERACKCVAMAAAAGSWCAVPRTAASTRR
jgi:hypothetical protein